MPYNFFRYKNYCPLTPDSVACTIGILIKEYLGTYTYDSGHTRPAVSINKPELDVRVEGIELVVEGAGNSTGREYYWKFYLLGRKDYDKRKLAHCGQLLRKAFLKGHSVTFLPETEEFNNFPQLVCEVQAGLLLSLRDALGIQEET